MDWTRRLLGWVLFVVGLVGIVASRFLSGSMAAGVGILSIVVLAAGVIIIGTKGRRRKSTSG